MRRLFFVLLGPMLCCGMARATDYTILSELKRYSNDSALSRNFGRALDLDGDTLIVGAAVSGPLEGRAEIRRRNHGGADAWQTIARLISPNGASNDRFAVHVALSGDWAVVGAISENGGAGAAYLYSRNQGGADKWGLYRQITSPSPANSGFGRVAIDGDTLVVGEPNGPTGGGVHIFLRNQGGPNNWGHFKTLSSPGGANAEFGWAVDIDGDHIVVGAPKTDVAGVSKGVAAIYHRNEGGPDNWGLVKTLRASDEDEDHRLGHAVAIYGDTIVVSKDRPVGDSGQAYIFRRNHGGANFWGEVDILTASDAAANDGFGEAVTVFYDSVLIGADGADGNKGAAYLFQRNVGGADQWDEVRKFSASDAASGDYFGTSVALNGANLFVGAPGDDDFFAVNGAVYIYPDECFRFPVKLQKESAAPSNGANFGEAVDAWGDVFVVGEPGFGPGTNGQVHLYYRNTGGADQWGSFTTLVPIALRTNRFGRAVALWDDTLVAAAEYDGSSVPDGGVAYVFSRNEGGPDNWGRVKRLLPIVSPTDSDFGEAVDIHCDTIVVGAPLADDLGVDSGAAFIYERNQGGSNEWGQVIRLTAEADGHAGDEFGTSVAIWGDLVAVGAPGVDPLNRGEVYLFARQTGGTNGWGRIARLQSPSPEPQDQFGYRVALYRDRLAVVQFSQPLASNSAVRLFEQNLGGPNNWGHRAFLQQPVDLGRVRSVALWDDLVAYGIDDSASDDIYVHHRNAGGFDQWGQVDLVDPPSGNSAADSLSIYGRRLLSGHREYNGTTNEAGTAFLFEPACSIVDTANDVVNGGDGLLSLREAIDAANASADSDCIVLSAGTYTITLPGSNEDANATGDFDILPGGKKLTIKGAGAKSTIIDGNQLDRVFHIHTNAVACIQDVTIQNGLSPPTLGAAYHGGGVYNAGTTMLYRVQVFSNATSAGAAGSPGGAGGGTYNTHGALRVYDSTIAYNRTGDGGETFFAAKAGPGGNGGGIASVGAEALLLDNCTVSSNRTGNGGVNTSFEGGDGGEGGGVYSFPSATSRLVHCTITGNHTGDGGSGNTGPGDAGLGGGVRGPTTVLGHTIISDNDVGTPGGQGPAIFGTVISEGYNLIDDESGTAWVGPTPGHVTNNAVLDPLADNGGPTCTHYPHIVFGVFASPVVNAGNPVFPFDGNRDQRGVLREPNAIIDIGAVETTFDFDSDGIEDGWESANGLDSTNPGDALIDQDFDNFTAGEEYISDTGPFTEGAHHYINDISLNSPVTVEVPSSADRFYRLWATTNLPAQNWNVVTKDYGNGGFLDLVDPDGEPFRAYRVTVELP